MFDKEADGKRRHDAARANGGFAVGFAAVAIEVADTMKRSSHAAPHRQQVTSRWV